MIKVVKISIENIELGAKIYIEAYAKEPWNEIYKFEVIHNYISRFILSDRNFGWILYDDHVAIGVMLGIIIPTPSNDYFRIEDLCISPNRQGLGYGTQFIKLISDKLVNYNVDSILLNTVKDFPSYNFYLKNNFTEITTSKMLYFDLVSS